MHIIERIYRVDDKTLQVDFTFDDPKSYMKPWTALMRFRLRPDWDIIEDACEDSFAFESFERWTSERLDRVVTTSHCDGLPPAAIAEKLT